ncbi:MAG: hypothetical protein M1826_004470 [Phylliscum demangeonii]|nr:MAG: hypothetical protein M1826_004470 [Phylliscum demangeonii]
MPLHLLGKKSWNVYNTDNVARVKRDEAIAQAREEEEERRMQEVDAERRMQILRSGSTRSVPLHEDHPVPELLGSERRRKRRKPGEDDTDREIRLAQETSRLGPSSALPVTKPSRPTPTDTPLVDRNGHINLFPEERRAKSQVAKNPEAEAEAAKKKREYEDQYTMRFSNAAGFKQSLAAPWYSSLQEDKTGVKEPVGKDVWGNEDHARKRRDGIRRQDDDPLAAMKKGVAELRDVEKERQAWIKARQQEMRAMEQSEPTQRRRSSKRRRHELEEDDLESFNVIHEAIVTGRSENNLRPTTPKKAVIDFD